MYQLKNWVLYLWNERHGVAFGIVYNNPRFPQGHEIQTSVIEKIVIEEEQGQLCIVTRSGSHYCLKYSEMNFDAIEKIKACLAVYNIPAEIFDKCVECIQRYKKDALKEVISKLHGEGLITPDCVNGESAHLDFDEEGIEE